jgi:HPt (histidine-containing phosphotransfer) domain-containing protein
MSELDARFAELRERFLNRSREDLRFIEAALADLDEADHEALRRTVHRLAGAAGTFGFSELSRLAGEADDALMVEMADVSEELGRVVAELRTALGEIAG